MPDCLWGLWVVSHERPDGFWYNHIRGSCEHDDTPQAFISRADAEVALDQQEGELYEGEVMIVALLAGVDPDDNGDC
jgi:hypothetical protein